MKKIQWMTVTILAVLVMVSCGRTAYVQKDADVDFSRIKTYSWVTTQANKETASVQTKNDDLTNRKIRQAIDKNLTEKGWKEVKKNPDVYLVYDVMIEEENKKVTTPVYSQSFTRWFFNPRNRRWVPVFYPSQFMGYDEEAWAQTAEYEQLPINVSLTMIHTIHAKLYCLFSNVKGAEWERTYIHSHSKKQFNLWYLLGMYAWHGKHHAAHIQV